MQQFACIEGETDAVYLPLHGFTAVDLGYQQGNAVSNIINKMDEPTLTPTYLTLFDQIWNDSEKLEDVTARLYDHIASVYQENSPERIYFLMLYNIFEVRLHREKQFNRKVELNARLRQLKQRLAALTAN